MSAQKALKKFQKIDVSIAMLEESESIVVFAVVSCDSDACTSVHQSVHSIHSISTPYTTTPRWDRSI